MSTITDALGELPALLTVAEVAAALRVDQRTVRRWISTGRLPSGRTTPVPATATGPKAGGGCGGRVLIPKSAVIALLEGDTND